MFPLALVRRCAQAQRQPVWQAASKLLALTASGLFRISNTVWTFHDEAYTMRPIEQQDAVQDSEQITLLCSAIISDAEKFIRAFPW